MKAGTTRPENRSRLRNNFPKTAMLRWALIFLIIGLVAGLLGFSGIAGASFAIAKVLFFVFMLVFLVLFVAGTAIGGRLGL